MSSIRNNKNSNSKSAQIKFAIDQHLISCNSSSDWILEKLKSSINDKVIATANLLANEPQLIGCTPLHLAVLSKNSHAFDALLNNGANVRIRNSSGSTALHLAIEQWCSSYGDFTFSDTQIEILLTHLILTMHIQFENFCNPCDRNGLSHFHAACMINYTEVVMRFLAAGISIDNSVYVDSPYFAGYTPLHFAVHFYASETVEILLAQGASRNLKDTQGLTPLHILLDRSIKYIKSVNGIDCVTEVFEKDKFTKIIRLFIEEHKDDARTFTDTLGLSDLHCICTIEDQVLLESYLKKTKKINHCVNMDSPLFPGYTALHFAAFFSIRNVKLLMQRGASMEAREANGLSPFDICVELYTKEEIYSILSMHPKWKHIALSNDEKVESSSISKFDSMKLTDLVICMTGTHKLAALLKASKNKANVSISVDSSLWPGFTPLHIAVMLSRTKNKNEVAKISNVIKQLYRYEADLNRQDVKGITPLILAFRQGKLQVVELLLCLRLKCQPVNVVDQDNLSHLHVLSYVSSFEYCAAYDLLTNILKNLMTRIDINIAYKGQSAISYVTSGFSPLHVAIASSHNWNDVPKLLLEYGADIFAKDSNGMTAIHVAMMRNDFDKEIESFASKLLSTASLRDSIVDSIQLSHLHVACYANHKAAVETLINRGADVSRAIARRTTNEICPFFDKFVGYTPLRFAVMNNNRSISMLLMRNGADIFTKEPNGMTSLYAALDQHKSNIFAFELQNNKDLQKEMNLKHGVTMLHIAVCSYDFKIAKIELDKKKTDVNAQVSSHSPIWPGLTPLHVFTFYNEPSLLKQYNVGDKETPGENVMFRMLLNSNADVTLSNSTGDTPLHIICREWETNYDNQINTRHKRPWLRGLLRAHRDFSINPTNAQGISFFHLACAIGEVEVVRKFLEHGRVDINQPIDHFSKIAPGCTPLHLAIRVECFTRFDQTSQIDIVDLLLKYGANVDVEDVSANTPLHDAVTHHYSVCEDFLERIVQEEADVNKHNIRGETPLEKLLNQGKVSIEKVKYFLKCGCRLNAINPVTRNNLWSLTLSSMTIEDVERLIFITSINFPQLLEADSEGRNIIHNIAAVSRVTVSGWTFSEISKYNQLILRIINNGCDIDAQDNLGRTALHIAARSLNYHGVSTLLKYGADINILNSSGQTAISSIFESDEESLGKHVHSTAQLLVMHVEHLRFCGIYVNEINVDFTQKIYDKLNIKQSVDKRFKDELAGMSKKKIGSRSLTVGDFLSDARAVSDYPGMSETKRKVIDRFVKALDWKFYSDYGKVVGLFLLQYRKAQARLFVHT